MLKNMPKVSIIVPAYNAEAFLAETLDSIQAQSLADFEVLVVDDGSTDQTKDIAQSFLKDTRFQYFYKENTGVSATRNYGLERCRGTYVCFFDADDLMLPDFLQACVATLEADSGKDGVYVAYEAFESGSNQPLSLVRYQPPGNEVVDLLTFNGQAGHPPSSVVVKTLAAQSVGGFDPALSTSADKDFWIRFAHSYRFAYCDRTLVRYRVHANQMHRNIDAMAKDMKHIYKKVKDHNLLGSRWFYRYAYARSLLVLSGSYYSHTSNYLQAIRYALLSFLTHPKPMLRKLAEWMRQG
ncbi:MAG: glycosyltransferase family 2 protein [Bacteroidetes bacterium]|nr:glycosyltransferase family 2 protein [Bacteroidota bacterium]